MVQACTERRNASERVRPTQLAATLPLPRLPDLSVIGPLAAVRVESSNDNAAMPGMQRTNEG
jgi:hypothetical protein